MYLLESIVISGGGGFFHFPLGVFGFDLESDNDGQRCCEYPKATTAIATLLVHTGSLQQLFEALISIKSSAYLSGRLKYLN